MASVTIDQVEEPSLTPEFSREELAREAEGGYKRFGSVDGILRSHARDPSNPVLFAYPVHGVADFEEYTAKDLDRFVDAAAAKYITFGVLPADPNLDAAPVMAIMSASSLEVFISLLALGRLGYAVLFLSTRLTGPALIRLLQQSDCHQALVSQALQKTVDEIEQTRPCKRFPIIVRDDFRHVTPTWSVQRHGVNPIKEGNKIGWIIHSSGSTGFPKPIKLTQNKLLANFAKGVPMRRFINSPLYHNLALTETQRSWYYKKPMYMANFAFPVTRQNMIDALKVAKPDMFCAVPYGLKLLAETEEGIDVLRDTKLVMFGGSACPQELGDKLTERGVFIAGNYGCTETGWIMSSLRPLSDKEWNWNRLRDPVAKHVLMDEVSPGVFEVVGLDGLPSKNTSNSDNPPNSFRTSDVFSRHPDPAKSNYYRYLGRFDDRLTLVNGEKVLPLPIEGRIRQDPLVRDVAVFGFGRTVPGAIVFRNESSAMMTDADFVKAIRPSVEEANASAEHFSRIIEDLIIPMPANTFIPSTDKSTFIRAQVYETFAKEIDAIYAAFEAADDDDSGPKQTLSIPELETFLLDTFANTLGVKIPAADSDIFSAGVDSLLTTRMYRIIKKEIDLGGNKDQLSSNVVYEQATIVGLARHLYGLREGQSNKADNETKLMRELIEKHSVFEKHNGAGQPAPTSQVVVLTGCTGSLGAYIASIMLHRPEVSQVWALVRAPDAATARSRVLSQLCSRQICPSASDLSKLVAMPSDLSRPDLGLSPSDLEIVRSSLTHVIHCAWAVNFNLPTRAFEAGNIAGVKHLINLCLSVKLTTPARFFFCSSISSVGGTPKPASIPEAIVEDLDSALPMGYGRSKLVAEHITRNAVRQSGGTMHARNLRIGQIAGDRQHGLWNSTEAFALMVRSALASSTGALPALDEDMAWMPVDLCAETIASLAMRPDAGEAVEQDLVYHVLNPHTFHWTKDLIPAIRATGVLPGFEVVPPLEWLKKLRQSNQDAARNPSVKLISYWEGKFAALKAQDLSGNQMQVEEAKAQDEDVKGLKFETDRTLKDAPVMGNATKGALIDSDYVSKLLHAWLKDWHDA